MGALGWFIFFKLLKRDMAGSGNLSLLEKLVPMLKIIEGTVPPPFGLSVIAVGEKEQYLRHQQ